jgi:hypothetical protein
MTDVVTPVLFLHIPKTAGTAVKIFFKQRLEGFVLQANDARQLADKDPLVVRVRDLEDIRRVLTDSGGLALHVDSNFEPIRRTTDFRSLAWHLFEPDNVAYFRQLSILTMFREPFRRFLSEYAFLRRTKAANPGFLPNLDVSSVEAYAGRVHANSVLHFLLEGDLSRPRTFTLDDLERVKEYISRYPIHVGIHEQFDESIRYFSDVLGLDFAGSDVPVLNAGEPVTDVPAGCEETFRERHALDIALYGYAVERFRLRAASVGD